MFLVCLPNFRRCTGRESCSVGDLSCVGVIAFEDEVRFALLNEVIVFVTRSAIVLIRLRYFSSILKGGRDRGKARSRRCSRS